MHGIYTNGHHLSLISAKLSENVALNPITSLWQSPTVMRRRGEEENTARGRQRRRDKEYTTEPGGGGSVEV